MSSSSTTTEEWVLELLAGFRFHPKEEQMVNLLKKKMERKDSQASQIMPEIGYQTWEPGNQSISLFLLFLREMMPGKNYPACQFIPEIDVLKSEPWDFPGILFPDSPYQAREWFAFSRPDHININSPRCNRATEKGFWKITGKPREIKSQEHSFTCKKRTLTFHIGRVSNSEKTNWIMHEYFPTETKLGSSGFVLIRVKNKSANNKSDSKKLKDTDEFLAYKQLENAVFGSDNHDASNHMITDTAEFMAYKELENAVRMLGSDNHDAGIAGCYSPSDLDHQAAAEDMIQEYPLHDHPPPEPPQPPQLGNVPDVSNDQWSNRQSPIGDNGFYLTSKNNRPANYGKELVSNVPSEAPDERTLEEQENLESHLHPSLLQACALQSPFNYREELGNFLHANNYIVCNESEFLHKEIPAIFP